MTMDAWMDTLAKDSATGLSRRQVFARVAGGFGMAALSVLGFGRRSKQCGRLCVECCKNNFPQGGREYGECVSSCHKGEGVCGPIVCPQ
jgi:hypothetical protein